MVVDKEFLTDLRFPYEPGKYQPGDQGQLSSSLGGEQFPITV
jgi:hypothetical protein